MSDESTSLTGRTDTMTDSSENDEFSLSEDEQTLISEIQSATGEYPTPSADSDVDPLELSKIDVVRTRSFEPHQRVIINIDDDGQYTLSLSNAPVDFYERGHFSYIFLNGKQIDIRKGGLELSNVPVHIYRTHNGEFIASIWT